MTLGTNEPFSMYVVGPILGTHPTPKYTEEEQALFKLKRHAIRRSLQSLARKSQKIRKDRFTKKGARPGLDEIRGKTSALLTIYLKLKGAEKIDCHLPKNPHSAIASIRRAWFEKYAEMFLGETFELKGSAPLSGD